MLEKILNFLGFLSVVFCLILALTLAHGSKSFFESATFYTQSIGLIFVLVIGLTDLNKENLQKTPARTKPMLRIVK